jgi:hypothetical protein
MFTRSYDQSFKDNFQYYINITNKSHKHKHPNTNKNKILRLSQLYIVMEILKNCKFSQHNFLITSFTFTS